jgi:hypothetical protein
MSPHESSSRRSSKRSKPTGDSKSAGVRGELFTVARTTDQLESTTEVEDEEDITRPVRSCVSNPSRPQLTEESLLQLEQSLPGYRLAHRNLHHWFFYIQSTILDSFDTYRDLPDRDFYPTCFGSPYSETPLSQADFQESHHSLASSIDLFRNTVRLTQEIQVVIPSRASSGPLYLQPIVPSDLIESSLGSPLSESTVDYPSEPHLSAFVPTPAESLFQGSELQQPLDTRQSRSRSRPQSSSSSSYHPRLASPLPIRRRITRSRSQRIRRQPTSPIEVISLSDS